MNAQKIISLPKQQTERVSLRSVQRADYVARLIVYHTSGLRWSTPFNDKSDVERVMRLVRLLLEWAQDNEREQDVADYEI